MTTAASFFISLLMGYLSVRLLFRKSDISWVLCCFFSVGVGLGLSALLTFYSFLIFDRFYPVAIFLIHAVVLFALAFYFHKKRKDIKTDFGDFQNLNRQYILGIACFIAALAVVILFAQGQPYGQWDAWALWNMKAKFLTTGGFAWKDAFLKLHWHTQPDYPLLLPMINIWGWVLDAKNFFTAPFVVSVLFAFSCGGLLY